MAFRLAVTAANLNPSKGKRLPVVQKGYFTGWWPGQYLWDGLIQKKVVRWNFKGSLQYCEIWKTKKELLAFVFQYLVGMRCCYLFSYVLFYNYFHQLRWRFELAKYIYFKIIFRGSVNCSNKYYLLWVKWHIETNRYLFSALLWNYNFEVYYISSYFLIM